MKRNSEQNFLPSKDYCCGCEACASKCPVGAIEMADDEEGFLYPEINLEKCIQCAACNRVCPVLNRESIKIDNHNIKCYAGYLKDNDKIGESASGGAATALAMSVIKRGGEVYGVSYSDDYRQAEYIKCQSDKFLKKLKGSKYIQSKKGDLYTHLEESLKKEKLVLVIGLPCEIGAIKSYLGDKYENLLTCELICHGPTSKKIETEFIDWLEKKYRSKVIDFNVRYKREGWTPPYVMAKFENGKKYEKLLYKTPFGYAFAIFTRPSCYNCSYKGEFRVADVTVGDFWGDIQKEDYYNSNGVSAIMVHTEKGGQIVSSLHEYMVLYEVEYNKIQSGNPRLYESESVSIKRAKFSSILKKRGLICAYYRTWNLSDIWRMFS